MKTQMLKYFKKKYFSIVTRLRFTSAFLCVLFSLLIYVNAPAHAEKKDEYHVKAIYTYRFIFFTEWPEKVPSSYARDTITIGIVGKDPFKNFFAKVENKMIAEKNKILKIIRLGRYNKKHDIKKCQILFIGKSEAENLNSILATIKNKPVLTVSDIDGFCEKGGMINLINVDNKINFEINLSAAKRVNLS
ncbi:MAG: YfiR family protein, partial [bacterium]|nr:YfiR family protein [bacterium]